MLDISLRFNIKEEHAFADVSVTFRANAQSTSRTVSLNAVGFLNLVVTGSGVTSLYDGKEIRVCWSEPFALEECRLVRFQYEVVHPISGLMFSHPDKANPNRPIYVATDHETERARYWLPCVDFPTVRTTLSFHLTAPASYSAYANGLLLSRDEHAAEKMATWNWKLDVLCPSYLICFGVGDLVQVRDEVTVDGMEVAYIAARGTEPACLTEAFGKTPAMVRWMCRQFGLAKWPFPKYFQLVLPKMPSAMENISLVTWSEMFLLDASLRRERGLLTDVVNVHEMAHSIFGDMLVIRHFDHAWLKESWATYVEATWIEQHLGADEFQYEMIQQASDYIDETDQYMRPIMTRHYSHSWDLYDMHLYPGGSWRLHMLRSLLGDDTFWTGVRNYVAQFFNGIVETDDFRRCLERVSGRNLSRFFDQWILSKGFPKLKGSFHVDVETHVVSISLEQTQHTKPTDPPLFDLAFPVELVDDAGSKTLKDLVFVDGRAAVQISVPAGRQIKQVNFDPKQTALFTLDVEDLGEPILSESAAKGADVESRIRAHQRLIALGTPSALRKVATLAKEEPFYGVRVKVAQGLAKATSFLAPRILVEMFVAEKDPRVVPAILDALRVKDDEAHRCLRNYLESWTASGSASSFVPYIAIATALDSLGSHEQPDDLPLLMSFVMTCPVRDFYHRIRRGAYRGIGNLHCEEAYDFLSSRLKAAEADAVRPVIVDALAVRHDVDAQLRHLLNLVLPCRHHHCHIGLIVLWPVFAHLVVHAQCGRLVDGYHHRLALKAAP